MPLKSSFVGQVVQFIILAEKARHNQNSVKITFFAPKVQKIKKKSLWIKNKVLILPSDSRLNPAGRAVSRQIKFKHQLSWHT